MTTRTLLLDPVIERLMEARPGPCVTITLPTHRTMPDANRDIILLKDLLREAGERLAGMGEKRAMAPIVEHLQTLAGSLDHKHQMDGLALFASTDHAETVKLPFSIEPRVAVGDAYVVRDVVRARLGSVHYHILALSQHTARLFAATDDHLVAEVRGGLPLENRHYTTDAAQVTTSRGQDNQARHWYTDVAKAVEHTVGPQGRVVVATTATHYAPFLDAAPHAALFIAHLEGNHEHDAPAELVRQAWTLAYNDQKRRHMADLEILARTPADKHVTTVDDIWARVQEGRGQTLLVERDLVIPGVVVEGRVQPDAPNDGSDLVDRIITAQLHHGGEVRMLPSGSLKDYDGIALITRY
ncbi:MAG: hypothetical protein IPJ87_05125 [Flavobacteriales bacterium]|jgi:hypothetical protein|nr:hypothetical protein [Flavobacteriales bacterium]MBK7941243.1 hypothetical protein [Flavobacteriales bacterium]MBK8948680.1 hypothetical protein [Flavobacteriales bacterium]MBK9701269.1 hypothetical protein [Flavobacteriales bacterium]